MNTKFIYSTEIIEGENTKQYLTIKFFDGEFISQTLKLDLQDAIKFSKDLAEKVAELPV